MLLTLWVKALKSRIAPPGSRGLAITDVPRLARDELGLSGLVMTTDLLKGYDRTMLGRVHEAADKAHCPVLVLAEIDPLPLASDDPDVVTVAQERCFRIAQAANWLQCAAFSISVSCKNDEDIAEAALNLKPVSRRAEKLELNLCIAPGVDATSSPEKITDLLKKIGGFRVGTLPDIGAALASDDPQVYLRRLAPYASAIVVPADTLTGESRPIRKAAPKAEVAPSTEPPKHKKAPKRKTSDPTAPLGASALGPAGGDAPVAGAPAGKKKAASEPVGSLTDLFKVLSAVGYDQSIALDYRGKADPIEAIAAARDELKRQLGLDQPEEADDPLMSLLGGDGDPVDAEPEPEED
jgi:hypothetical protein